MLVQEWEPNGRTLKQAGCPLFNKLPPEIRIRIFELALKAYDDKSRPFDEDSTFFCPGHRYPQIQSTTLLRTCRRIYLETCLLPIIVNGIVSWHQRGPPNSLQDPRDLLHLFNVKQRAAVHYLHLHTTQLWLEGDDWQTLLRSQDVNPKRIQITMMHEDWSPYSPSIVNFNLDPKRKTPAISGVQKESWGDAFRHLVGLREFKLELEATDYMQAELADVITRSPSWQFQLGDGNVLVLDESKTTSKTWVGKRHKGRYLPSYWRPPCSCGAPKNVHSFPPSIPEYPKIPLTSSDMRSIDLPAAYNSMPFNPFLNTLDLRGTLATPLAKRPPRRGTQDQSRRHSGTSIPPVPSEQETKRPCRTSISGRKLHSPLYRGSKIDPFISRSSPQSTQTTYTRAEPSSMTQALHTEPSQLELLRAAQQRQGHTEPDRQISIDAPRWQAHVESQPRHVQLQAPHESQTQMMTQPQSSDQARSGVSPQSFSLQTITTRPYYQYRDCLVKWTLCDQQNQRWALTMDGEEQVLQSNTWGQVESKSFQPPQEMQEVPPMYTNPSLLPRHLTLHVNGNHALQDYQMQLMLLEQQNKKRLWLAKQDQDGPTREYHITTLTWVAQSPV